MYVNQTEETTAKLHQTVIIIACIEATALLAGWF